MDVRRPFRRKLLPSPWKRGLLSGPGEQQRVWRVEEGFRVCLGDEESAALDDWLKQEWLPRFCLEHLGGR